MSEHLYPRTFSHIGNSVPDVERAVKFYSDVLGWYTIMEPTDIVEDDSDIGEMCTDSKGCFNLKPKKAAGITSNIGKLGCFTFVFKTLMLKG